LNWETVVVNIQIYEYRRICVLFLHFSKYIIAIACFQSAQNMSTKPLIWPIWIQFPENVKPSIVLTHQRYRRHVPRSLCLLTILFGWVSEKNVRINFVESRCPQYKGSINLSREVSPQPSLCPYGGIHWISLTNSTRQGKRSISWTVREKRGGPGQHWCKIKQWCGNDVFQDPGDMIYNAIDQLASSVATMTQLLESTETDISATEVRSPMWRAHSAYKSAHIIWYSSAYDTSYGNFTRKEYRYSV